MPNRPSGRRPAVSGHRQAPATATSVRCAHTPRGQATANAADGSSIRDEGLPIRTDAVTTLLSAAELPLLAAEEEADLLKRVRRGRAAAAMVAAGDVTDARRQMLGDLVDDGERAAEHLVRANLRLVAKIAYRFAPRGDVDDLVADGIGGLLDAVEQFDPARGVRFSTYATWPITKAVSLAAGRHGGPVRLPQGVHELRMRAANVADRITRETGTEPSVDELAAALDVDTARLQTAIRRIEAQPLDTGDPGSVCDVPDDARTTEEMVEAAETVAQVRAAVATLPADHARILVERFGLDGRPPRTLADLAATLGVDTSALYRTECRLLDALHGQLAATP